MVTVTSGKICTVQNLQAGIQDFETSVILSLKRFKMRSPNCNLLQQGIRVYIFGRCILGPLIRFYNIAGFVKVDFFTVAVSIEPFHTIHISIFITVLLRCARLLGKRNNGNCFIR